MRGLKKGTPRCPDAQVPRVSLMVMSSNGRSAHPFAQNCTFPLTASVRGALYVIGCPFVHAHIIKCQSSAACSLQPLLNLTAVYPIILISAVFRDRKPQKIQRYERYKFGAIRIPNSSSRCNLLYSIAKRELVSQYN